MILSPLKEPKEDLNRPDCQSAKNKKIGGTAEWRQSGGLAAKWRNGGKTADWRNGGSAAAAERAANYNKE